MLSRTTSLDLHMEVKASEFLAIQEPSAIDRLAELVISRFLKASELPVDLEYVASHFAQVSKVEWEIPLDGITLDLLSTCPRIFLRDVPANFLRRQRFTLAHELGHVLIPWHTSQIVCSLSNHGIDGMPDYEHEANYFASRLLMPFSHVQRLASSAGSLASFLNMFDRFQASPDASVIALTQLLVPGFIFRYWAPDKHREYSSDPNLLFPHEVLRRERQLEELAILSGEFSIDSRCVSWYFLGDTRFRWDSSFSEERRSIEILREVLSRGAFVGVSERTINGIVSGLLGKLRTYNLELLYSHVNLRLRFHEGIPEALQQDAGFQLYLRKFIVERVIKEQAKR